MSAVSDVEVSVPSVVVWLTRMPRRGHGVFRSVDPGWMKVLRATTCNAGLYAVHRRRRQHGPRNVKAEQIPVANRRGKVGYPLCGLTTPGLAQRRPVTVAPDRPVAQCISSL